MQKDEKAKRGVSRRKFFKAGVLSSLTPFLLGKELSFAQTHKHSESKALVFFNSYQAVVVEAVAARIIPGNEQDPGAREAEVVQYIDRALAGTYTDLQGVYRRGINAMDGYAEKKFRKNFIELTEAQQDQVLQDLEQGKASGFTHPSAQEFFTVLYQHTLEGMFSDPIYGGNKGAAGWKLIGFPGAQYAYSAEEMRPDADLSRKQIVTLQDLS